MSTEKSILDKSGKNQNQDSLQTRHSLLDDQRRDPTAMTLSPVSSLSEASGCQFIIVCLRYQNKVNGRCNEHNKFL